MAIVPKRIVDRIQFYLNHLTPFTTHATAIGLEAEEVADLGTKAHAAQTALSERSEAQQTAQNKTVALHDAVQAMSIAGAALIEKIRAKAKQAGPEVYTLAEIPPPATPSSPGIPGTPESLRVTLNSSELLLKWKCKNPPGCTGVMYQVWRSCDGGEFEYLGGAGQKSFIDSTVPAGTSAITYKIQGVRSMSVGLWAEFNVRFGAGGQSVTVTAVTEKMAA